MKLTLGLAAALAGCAAAAQQAAEVHFLPNYSTASKAVSRSLARLVLLQRLAPAGKGPSVNEIPDGTDAEDVVYLMNNYGKESSGLFSQGDVSPSQLVVMLEGLSDDQMKEFGRDFKSTPALTITDTPSASANEKLLKNDIYNAGVTNEHKCSIKEVSNPFETKCWSGKSTVAKYNVQKDPSALKDLVGLATNLERLAASGEMQTTVILFPASTQNSNIKQWSDKSQELRRRQLDDEQVFSASNDVGVTPPSNVEESPASQMTAYFASSANVPSCFSSKDKCLSDTGKCSGHGTCVNKSKSDKKDDACYVCQCNSPRAKNEDERSLDYWVGPTCARKDISTPFWLFAGFTILMVGILTISLSLLYSVGDETLPGVLGAGVSKTK